AQRNQLHPDAAPSQLAGGGACGVLGPQSRRPSRTRPDGPWLADVERTGELGKNQKETRANKGAGQASPPQAGSVSTHQTPATPKVTVQHSARVKNCLVQVFAGKDECPLPLFRTLFAQSHHPATIQALSKHHL